MLSAAVPFVSLYNRVADARPTNLDDCVAVAAVRGPRGRNMPCP
jgi:hypothetical protein